MAVGCKIYKDFKRPDKELVELFRDMPVANIGDIAYDVDNPVLRSLMARYNILL